MNVHLSLAAFLLIAGFALQLRAAPPTTAPATQPSSPLDFMVKDIDGHDVNLADYKGKIVLLVNVASKCGYTPQYEGLERIYNKYKDRGFVIIGFPANNFGSQEPGSNEQIKEFCTSKYSVTFPMMSKISVKGADKDPLYHYLSESPTAGKYAGEIGWNFTKFLVGPDGKVVARFPSKVTPESPELTAAIEAALKAAGK
jgi:glutathione peroxidase